MIAATLKSLDWQKLRLTRSDGLRGIAAGGVWGLVVAAGLIAAGLWDCGAVSAGDAAFTASASVAAGLMAIGPIAAFGGRR